MKVFVSGASGWIGSAVVPDLLQAGHEVVGLARSDASAEKLAKAGAAVVRGDIDDPAGLAEAADNSDGVLHLAFQHEIAFGGDFPAAAAADRRAVEAIGAALAGSNRPLVIASGVLGLSHGAMATENDGLVPNAEVRSNPASRRLSTALLTLSLAGVDVRSAVLRLPPTVHGDGDNGFVATFVDIARQQGSSGYVGDGSNRWPAVHVSDAARLARLAVESAPAGSVLHAIGDEGVAFGDIAKAIGEGLGVPASSLSPQEAATRFGPLGHFVAIDCPTSAEITSQLLDWKPTGPSLLEDLSMGHYFRDKSA